MAVSVNHNNFRYELGFNKETKEAVLKAKCLNKGMSKADFDKSFEVLREQAWAMLQAVKPYL